MWDKLRTLVTSKEPSAKTGSVSGQTSVAEAVAALLVYTASLDDDYSVEERERILEILRRQEWETGLSPEGLLLKGETMSRDALDCYGFVRILGSEFSEDDRLKLMRMMWQVVMADGVLDEYETNMMRRIAGLLGVSDRDNGRLRQAALEG